MARQALSGLCPFLALKALDVQGPPCPSGYRWRWKDGFSFYSISRLFLVFHLSICNGMYQFSPTDCSDLYMVDGTTINVPIGTGHKAGCRA